MKLDQFTAKVSAAICAQREAFTAISTKRSAAQTTLATFASAPSAKGLPDAIHARHDLDALERIVADMPSAERSEADLRDRLTALHADELANELSAQIVTRSAGRAAFRKRHGEIIAKLSARIATDDTLTDHDCYLLGIERTTAEGAITNAERELAEANRAVATLRSTPSWQAFEDAKGVTSNVTF
jgi:hypothetical protein